MSTVRILTRVCLQLRLSNRSAEHLQPIFQLGQPLTGLCNFSTGFFITLLEHSVFLRQVNKHAGQPLLRRLELGRKQWDGRPHPGRHQCAKVEVSPTT